MDEPTEQRWPTARYRTPDPDRTPPASLASPPTWLVMASAVITVFLGVVAWSMHSSAATDAGQSAADVVWVMAGVAALLAVVLILATGLDPARGRRTADRDLPGADASAGE